MPEFLFNKVPGLRPASLLKREYNTGVFANIAKFLKTPPVAASEITFSLTVFELILNLFGWRFEINIYGF